MFKFMDVQQKRKMTNPYKIKKPTSTGGGGGTGSLPIGTVLSFAGEKVPAGYLECNGKLLIKDSYPKLFEAIGATYGG